jgi:hypothetical protein
MVQPYLGELKGCDHPGTAYAGSADRGQYSVPGTPKAWYRRDRFVEAGVSKGNWKRGKVGKKSFSLFPLSLSYTNLNLEERYEA